jgi:hypothetical protein
MITTPKRITPAIRKFCRTIDPTQTPVYVPVQPDRGAEPNMCFPVVNQKVQRDGGSIQHGWTIWEWPSFMLEAEFHAVWVTPDGTYLDVVPKVDGERRILFLPDSQRVWERKVVPNRRKALRCYNPILDEYLATAKEMDELSIRYCQPDGTRALPQNLWSPLQLKLAFLGLAMMQPPGTRIPVPPGVDLGRLAKGSFSAEPPLEEVDRPTLEEVNRPTLEEVNRPTLEEVNRPTLEEVNRPTLEEVNRPKQKKMIPRERAEEREKQVNRPRRKNMNPRQRAEERKKQRRKEKKRGNENHP